MVLAQYAILDLILQQANAMHLENVLKDLCSIICNVFLVHQTVNLANLLLFVLIAVMDIILITYKVYVFKLALMGIMLINNHACV